MSKVSKITRITRQKLPREIVHQVKKGGATLDYVSGETVLDLMTLAFGPTFSISYGMPWIDHFDPVKNSKGEVYTPTYVVTVKATITVPMIDPETKQPINVVREGFGTALMKQKFEEMVLKTAQTDAFKKAAYSFGIAGELFRKNGEQPWFERITATWNEHTMNAYAAEWNIIKQFMQQKHVDSTYINALATQVTKGDDCEVTPGNIDLIVAKIQDFEQKVA